MLENLIAARIIRQAKRLLGTPKNWTKGAYKRETKDSQGNVVSCRYCVLGAMRAASEGCPEGYNRAWRYLNAELPEGETLAGWNDLESTKHEDILGLFDRAMQAVIREDARGVQA